MKAFILAAGLGTRLKPWTEHHPKALVPVGGEPMLKRVILKLKSEGFDEITVNVHHFANQIIDFLSANDFGVQIHISDEREELLDTGGAILHASKYLASDNRPFLIHNVDILSNADLVGLMSAHETKGYDCTLLVSNRNSSRKLLFDEDMSLKGWCNLHDRSYRPIENGDWLSKQKENGLVRDYAFSGIHVMSPTALAMMKEEGFSGKFSVIDFFLGNTNSGLRIKGELISGLELIDIGKPDTLSRANALLTE